jgi:tRNA-2-methylthio-N6-dimethylallyladenosine synthase
MPSVFIKTYGCQMNERDSEAVAAQFVARGYSLALSETAADVVLLNTCSVRESAEQRALGKMAALSAQLRRRRPDAILGYVGCMAQSRAAELLAPKRGVRLVLGTQKFHRAVEYIEDLRAGRRADVCDVAPEPGSESAIRDHVAPPNGQPRPVTAFVSIMQGCNQQCSFCIVPHTRGRERSRSIDDIVAECRELADRGVREVTLLGQIVTSYARGEIPARGGRSPFVQLLDAVHAIDRLDRIRFTSPHPRGYGPDLVDAYTRLPKLGSSAHLPVQSGSNRILRLMRRGYTRERYLDLVGQLRQARPGLAITTDFIVGFPGEMDADFADTLDLARQVQFDSAYLFKYSARRNTPTATLPDQVPVTIREQRHAQLLDLVNAFAAGQLADLVGRTLPVLVSGPSRRNPARLEGRTSCNKIVVFEGSPRHVGALIDIRIVRATATTLYGDPAILNLD